MDARIDRVITGWKGKLVDVTRRNRLVYFKPSKNSTLVVSHPAPDRLLTRLAVSEDACEFWLPPEDEDDPNGEERVPVEPRELPLRMEFDPTAFGDGDIVCADLGRKQLERVLKNLYRRSNTDYQERGVRILFVAFGVLVWKEIETSEEVRSPLVLVPVELSRESARDPFTIQPVEEDPAVNPALQVKLHNDFNLTLPPFPDDWEETKLTDYLQRVQAVVEPLVWRVEETAQIGLFSFHKLVIFEDLAVHAELMAGHPVISALAGVPKDFGFSSGDLPDERELDCVQEPAQTFQILDADSSQRLCIEAANGGRSFVLQGPPGTGKSQTIANIIAEFLAHGRTVLFVSEKMAALEVVFKRLRESNLGSLCLELHSHKSNKREVVAELKRSLDEHLVAKTTATPMDFEKLMRLRAKLNEFVLALHRVREPLQRTAYDVLGELAKLKEQPLVASDFHGIATLTPARMQAMDEHIRSLRNVWHVVTEGQEFPWHGLTIDTYSARMQSELLTQLDSLRNAMHELDTGLRMLAAQIGATGSAAWLFQVGNILCDSPAPEPHWITVADLDQLSIDAKRYEELCSRYWILRNNLKSRYGEAVFGVSDAQITDFESAWLNVQPVLSPGDPRGTLVFPQRRELERFLAATLDGARAWLKDSQELGQRLGVSISDPSPHAALTLARLGLLCCAGSQPEISWFEPTRMAQVVETVAEVKRKWTAITEKRERTLATFDEGVFKLDLDRLITQFSGPYVGLFRWFRPKYYRDKATLAGLTTTGVIPRSVRADLFAARELKRVAADMAAQAETVKKLLGDRYRGAETDFAELERAVEIAQSVLEIIGRKSLPDGLKQALSHGSECDPEVGTTAQRLRDQLDAWEASIHKLKAIGTMDRLPGLDRPILGARFSAIEQWASKAHPQLAKLCDVANVFIAGDSDVSALDIPTIIADLKTRSEMRRLEAGLMARQDALQNDFGKRYTGLETGWSEVLTAIDWVKQLRAAFGSRAIPEATVDLAARGRELRGEVDRLTACHRQAVELLRVFENRFEPPGPMFQGTSLRKQTVPRICKRLDELHSRIDALRDWCDFKSVEARFAEQGLNSFLKQLVAQPPHADCLPEVFRKAVYQAWLDSTFEAEPALREFRGENHEQLIAEFRELDRKLLREAAPRVITLANEKRPQSTFIPASDSEIGVLLHESAKKMRHLPVRRLFERIPNLLPRLKPCLLMSPLSVSQFLHPERLNFDLVIFDEASQICPEDAVAAIYRGKQLVVAGDSKQLPPTAFFAQGSAEEYDTDDEDEEEFAVFDSILDQCSTVGLGRSMLRWHYRSRHENLIAFSNRQYYDSHLVTFPASQLEHDSLGVKFLHVPDGVYDRGGRRDNQREAQVVTDLVVDHLLKYGKTKSLGVIAFSQAQMTAIEDQIELRRKQQTELEQFFSDDRLEGFFVKNLENVQGDERDVIIFSIGYGKDEHGRLTMNFGPINRPGGERRLNVAVTRAREKVIVVSSIRASDFDLGGAPNPGVLNLHRYLDYAERGTEALQLQDPRGAGEPESPLESDVAAEIRQLGYQVAYQVGCSSYRIDIGVIDPAEPGRFLLGVECDGATYHSAYTARDRDRLRQQILENLGWRIHRVWSTDWVSRRVHEIQRLRQAIETATKAVRGDASRPLQPPQDNGEQDDGPVLEVRKIDWNAVSQSGRLYGTVPYPVCQLSSTAAWSLPFHAELARSEQCDLLSRLVRQEGPIHFDYAARRLVEAWNLSRRGSRIERAMRDVVRRCERAGRLRVVGDFLWPTGTNDVRVRTPVANETNSYRPLDLIPPEEIRAAMLLIVQQAIGIPPESLLKQTRQVFGIERIGSSVRDALETVYEQMIREGSLVENGETVAVGAAFEE